MDAFVPGLLANRGRLGLQEPFNRIESAVCHKLIIFGGHSTMSRKTARTRA